LNQIEAVPSIKGLILINKDEVKQFIVNILKDDDVTADKISDDSVLIGENGIFFDSVDVLELIVELENIYGIKVSDRELIQEKFKDFKSLYEFIIENKK
jgi:acyl carrier protein